MKKLATLVGIWAIALWPPVIFPLFIGYVQARVQFLVLHTIDSRYYWVSMVAYAISGLIFAVAGFKPKEYCKRKDTFYAHIAAIVLIVLFCALFLLNLKANSFTNELFAIIFVNLYRDWHLLCFAFAYSLYTSIKAIIIYRKQIG